MNPKGSLVELEVSPQAHYFSLTAEDQQQLKGQFSGKKFTEARLLGGARRCIHGAVQVVCCRPLLDGEAPFPTLFWLSCPHLDLLCGRLEASGIVGVMQDALKEKSQEWLEYHRSYAALRRHILLQEDPQFSSKKDDKMLESLLHSGVGGINFLKAPTAAKCLHLQVATWLALKHHPLESLFSRLLFPLDCKEPPCLSKE